MQSQLRELILKQDATPYAIAHASGVDMSAMSRFINGGDLSNRQIDKLTQSLGLVFTVIATKTINPLKRGRPAMKGKP